jgi:rubredoxin
MKVNLKCVDCGFVFDAELGKLEMDNIGTLIYQNKPSCPKCKAYDKVYITETGFKQLSEWFPKYLDQNNG